MTFGYARAEPVAALINYTTLIAVGLYLLWEGVLRLIDPQPVDGWLVVIIAAVALVVDTATVLLTLRLSRNSSNIRAAFLHNLADALGSLGVIVAGTLILLYDWRLVDPLVTLAIAGYILWQALAEIGPVIRVLMLGVPVDHDSGAVLTALADIDGIAEVHHAHLWQMDEQRVSFEAHLVIEAGRWGDADAIKAAARRHLHAAFGIDHCTLETECMAHACEGAQVFGHPAAHDPHLHHA